MPDLKKKLGPLPVWAWGLIIGVGALIVYRHYASSQASSSTAQTTGILDPNAVDPNTGLTYGQEEAAAMSPSDAGGGESGAQGTNPPSNEFGDFLTFLDEWNQFANAMGWVPPGSTSTGPSTTTSSTTTAASQSPVHKKPTAPARPGTPTPQKPSTAAGTARTVAQKAKRGIGGGDPRIIAREPPPKRKGK